MRRSVLSLSVVALLVAGTAPAVAAEGPLPPGPSPTALRAPAAPSAIARTQVQLRVRGCDGCTIGVQRALSPGGSIQPPAPDYWNGPRAKVRNGSAVLSVPTAYTAGMSFYIRAPWETGSYDAVPNIVLGVKGRATGTRLSAADVRGTRRATACWAGTAEPTTTVNVKVVRATRRGLDGPSTIPMSWAKPTVPTVGRMQRAYGGILANQDAFFC